MCKCVVCECLTESGGLVDYCVCELHCERGCEGLIEVRGIGK